MFKLFLKPSAPITPTKVAALKVFCAVRHAQRCVSRIPNFARSVASDVSDAWEESAHIVPK